MSFNPNQPAQAPYSAPPFASAQQAPPAQQTPGAPWSAAQPGSQPGAQPAGRPARRRPAYALLALGWEALLLLSLVVMLVVAGTQTDVLGHDGIWRNMAVTGLLATGFALSLRAATPNLAVVSLATLAGGIYAVLLDNGWEWLPAMATGVAGAAAVGLLLGLIAGLTMAPAWAVSLLGMAGVQAGVYALIDNRGLQVDAARIGGNANYVWLAVFVLLSVGGGLLCLIPGVRRLLGGFRINGDDASWRGRRLVSAVIGFTGSSLLAGLAGVLLTNMIGFAQANSYQGELFTIVGIALLGGVSAFGARAGVAGVVLATGLVVTLEQMLFYWDVSSLLATSLSPALAIIVGLLVSRVLESIAGPPEPAATAGGADLAPVGAAAPGSPASPAQVSPGSVPAQHQPGGWPAAGYQPTTQADPSPYEPVEPADPLPRRPTSGPETH